MLIPRTFKRVYTEPTQTIHAALTATCCAQTMSCQKGKPIRKAKPGDYRCKECGFVTAKKKKLCKPKKVK
jgi:hypothetical protein